MPESSGSGEAVSGGFAAWPGAAPAATPVTAAAALEGAASDEGAATAAGAGREVPSEVAEGSASSAPRNSSPEADMPTALAANQAVAGKKNCACDQTRA